MDQLGPEDFGANLARGAAIGNMRVQQMERQQELQSQAALRAIQERQIAQEVQFRAELYQKQKAQDEQDQADLAGFSSLYQEQLSHKLASAQMSAQETGEPVDAGKIQADTLNYLLPGLAAKNYSAATKVVKAIQPVLADQSRVEAAQLRAGARGTAAAFEPHVGIAKGPNGEEFQYFQESPNRARMLDKDGAPGAAATPVTDPDGNTVGFMVGKHFVSKESAQVNGATPANKALVQTWTDQVKQLNKKRNELEGDDAATEAKRADIGLQIVNLEKRITKTLGAKGASVQAGKTATVPATPKKLKFVPGKGLVPADEEAPAGDVTGSGE